MKNEFARFKFSRKFWITLLSQAANIFIAGLMVLYPKYHGFLTDIAAIIAAQGGVYVIGEAHIDAVAARVAPLMAYPDEG